MSRRVIPAFALDVEWYETSVRYYFVPRASSLACWLTAAACVGWHAHVTRLLSDLLFCVCCLLVVQAGGGGAGGPVGVVALRVRRGGGKASGRQLLSQQQVPGPGKTKEVEVRERSGLVWSTRFPADDELVQLHKSGSFGMYVCIQ